MGGRLDRTTTNCCKGIAAMIIMLHHISFRVSNLPVYVKPIWYIAFPIVGFFFFMSGYGLTCGLLQKKNYLQGFLSKRLLNIIAPYVIVAITWIGLEIIWGGQTPVRAIAEAFTIRYIQPLWFIWVIIAAYIMFYAVFRHTEINVGGYWFTSITIAYILISAFVNPRDEMYASIIGMPLGILWAVYERKIDSYFEIYFLRKEIVAIAAFVVLFIGRLVLSVAGFDNHLLQSVLRNIITIAFIVPLVGLLKNVRIQNRFLIWLGTISYEIYIIHPFILYFFEKETAEGKRVGSLEIVLWTIGLTLLLSSVLKVVQDNLVRKVRS